MLHRWLIRPIRDDCGATAVEYALLASLIAALMASIIAALGQASAAKLETVEQKYSASQE